MNPYIRPRMLEAQIVRYLQREMVEVRWMGCVSRLWMVVEELLKCRGLRRDGKTHLCRKQTEVCVIFWFYIFGYLVD